MENTDLEQIKRKINSLVDLARKNFPSKTHLVSDEYGRIDFECSLDYLETLVEATISIYRKLVELRGNIYFLNKKEQIKEDCFKSVKGILLNIEKERHAMEGLGFNYSGYWTFENENLLFFRNRMGGNKYSPVSFEIVIYRKKDGEIEALPIIVKNQKDFIHALYEYVEMDLNNMSLLPVRVRDIFSKGLKQKRSEQ